MAKKKKILLLSDDLRMHSGIGTMSKEFVLGTIDKYDWVQLGAAIKHPDEGKVFDMNETIRKETGVKDAYLKIYPSSGYGNPDVIRHLIDVENPDAILHFTDPRFWGWLYQMEHELRQEIPLMYYTIWDDLPYPRWNEPFYESCDLLMCISRQTTNIVKNVVREFPKEDWQIQYVPHGINEKEFFPLTEEQKQKEEYSKFKNKILDGEDYNFIMFYNNRNIRRKMPGDVILAYKQFCDSLPKEEADKCLLLFHTHPVDQNGTDLPAVIREICPMYPIKFTKGKYDTKHMNYLYNMSDVTINIASNEGFGLSSAESIMTGTPIINNTTGGLQDQVGFKKEDGSYLTVDDYTTEWGSNHDGRYKEHGEWAKPVFPASRALMGSPPTPYIFDDRCRWEDAGDKMKEWYDVGAEERQRCGKLGREWALQEDIGLSATEMCNRFIKNMDTCFEKWTPRKQYSLYKV